MQNYRSLEPFFSPKSVAVIGASNQAGSVGYTIFKNLKAALPFHAYPINPNHATVQGIRSYTSINGVEEKIDLAVIVTPAHIVPTALQECAQKKVRAAIIVSAGFSEVGEKNYTAQIRRIIAANPHMRVMGPNCVGVKNLSTGIDTTFFDQGRMKEPRHGSLSFISQSGALGSMILDWVSKQHFGINKFVSYGNAMDVDEADLLEYFAQDKSTKVITAYLEGARDGRKFFDVAKMATLKKPVIVLKGGRFEKTSRATASHTGSLAGSEKVYEAVFRQSGIIQARGMQDLFNTGKLFERENLPKGRRVAIITNGGGFGIVMADHVINNGMELADLSAKTKKNLEKKLKVSIGNPIDLLGDADAQRYDAAIKACLLDPNVDILVVMCLFTLSPLRAQEMKILEKPRGKKQKTMVVVAVGGDYTEQQLEKIEKSGFTAYDFPGTAAKALGHAAEYSEFLKRSRN